MCKKEIDTILEESRRLHELATEGPWERWDESICANLKNLENGKTSAHWLFEIDFQNQDDLDDENESETADANTHFVCHARTAIPALVAEVERLRGLVKEAFEEGWRHGWNAEDDNTTLEKDWQWSDSAASVDAELKARETHNENL